MTIKFLIFIFSTLCILTVVDSFFEQVPIIQKPRPPPPPHHGGDGPKKTRQEIRRERGGLPEAHQLTIQEKQKYIKDAFVFSWEGYKNYSWGFDENRPASNRPRNTRFVSCFLFTR